MNIDVAVVYGEKTPIPEELHYKGRRFVNSGVVAIRPNLGDVVQINPMDL